VVFHCKEELKTNDRIPTNKQGRIKQKAAGKALLARNRQTTELLNSADLDAIVESAHGQLSQLCPVD
jgi:hypothetical protein